jgi:hypothetical protein
MAKESKTSPSAFVLEFIASLFFLGVLAMAAGKGYTTGALVSGAGALWVPVLFGVAAVGAITLLVASFANLSGSLACQQCAHSAKMVAIVTAVALFALTALDVTSLAAVAIGLILALVGSLAGHQAE